MRLIQARGQLCRQAIETSLQARQHGIAPYEQTMDVPTPNLRGHLCPIALGIVEIDEQALRIVGINLGRQVERLYAFNQGPATP
jgi:hypothetical protein